MNLLSNAMRQIASQPVFYYEFESRSTNELGYEISTFKDPVIIRVGSVQPIKKEKYQFLGLDLAKDYIRWWVPQEVFSVDRDISGDQIGFNTYRWNVEGRTSWVLQDGWVCVICIKLDEDTL